MVATPAAAAADTAQGSDDALMGAPEAPDVRGASIVELASGNRCAWLFESEGKGQRGPWPVCLNRSATRLRPAAADVRGMMGVWMGVGARMVRVWVGGCGWVWVWVGGCGWVWVCVGARARV